MEARTYISHSGSPHSRQPHPRVGQRPTPTPRRPSRPQARQAAPGASSPTSTHLEHDQSLRRQHVTKATTRLLVKSVRVGQKEREAGPPRGSRRAHVAVEAVPEQRLAGCRAESTVLVRTLRLEHVCHEHVHLVASFGRRPTGYVCGYLGEGCVGCESGICGRDEMGAESVDAMGGGVKDGRSGRRGECRRFCPVKVGVRKDGA
jgi:hypothetical protein